jgi:hypothetical protein
VYEEHVSFKIKPMTPGCTSSQNLKDNSVNCLSKVSVPFAAMAAGRAYSSDKV